MHETILPTKPSLTPRSQPVEVLLFGLGGTELFAVDITRVREIASAVPVGRVPNAPPVVRGYVSLREQVLALFSLCALLGQPGLDAAPLMLIVEADGREMALEVQSVLDIVPVGPAHVVDASSILGPDALVQAIVKLEGGATASLLDIGSIAARVSNR